ncbi:MAG: GGDEF domain-containing protein [Pseudomonadota bacterium]
MVPFTADVPTMLVMIILSSLAAALAMAVVTWGKRREGVELWALGLLLNAMAYALFASRGHIHALLSIVLGNVLLCGVFTCMGAAVLQFQGRPLPWPTIAVTPVLMASGMAWFIDDYAARVVVAGLLLGALNLWILWILFIRRASTAGRGVWLVMAALGLQALVFLVRVVVVGGSDQPASGIMQSNGVQTLTFSTTFIELMVATMGFIFMARDRADENNRRMAALDPLTGVANRRAAIAALDRDVARAVRTRESISVMMVDIDHFKRVNDQYGHPVGDQVLCHVVSMLRDRIRSQDLVSRYGGEEFLVVLPDTDLIGAHQLARQLCESVSGARYRHEGKDITVTVSIGVFGGRLEPGDSWDMLISAADRALYRAKELGRNRVEAAIALHPPSAPSSLDSSPETLPTSSEY